MIRQKIRPVDVQTEKATKILMFLNNAKTPQEIAAAIEIPNERDIGLKVAETILERRKELGEFSSLEQVSKISEVGPERFTDLINSLSTRKGEAIYTIKGQLESKEPLDFSKLKLTVHAWRGETELAKGDVDAKGAYSLDFKAEDKPMTMELRVLPTNLSKKALGVPSLSGTINALYFKPVKGKNAFQAEKDFRIPGTLADAWLFVVKLYNMTGTVYLVEFENGTLKHIVDTIANAKIEFYEVSPLPIPIYPPIINETLLGYAYTDPKGEYTFDFNYSYMRYPPFPWFTDQIPDIRARVYQFDGTKWVKVYESEIDWNIQENEVQDFFIDIENALLKPVVIGKPASGFLFTSVGLLPIDFSRISNGYATADSANDPDRIKAIYHQPFCGELRIFGLFAEAPPVTKYKVQIAEVAEANVPLYPTTYVPTNWQYVTDNLQNNKWNSTTKKWEPDNDLGPDANNFYKNIDNVPDTYNEFALKVTWKSWRVPNGFYALQIIGYDANGAEVAKTMMPIMRIDNTLPDFRFDVLGNVDECGMLVLDASRKIDFKVTITDDEGHILSYQISGTRGRGTAGLGAPSAGSTISRERPNKDLPWGLVDKTETFTVAPRTAADILNCPTLAYGFVLEVWGSATDCYWPKEQYVTPKTINLIVTEPQP
jgi:hypothetical protein